MIFNLNKQKVLSGPSGSAVFRGENNFNDIVVNLPHSIDGHIATNLNYVMHFVNGNGDYSTKILNVDSSDEELQATATIDTNITSQSQVFAAFIIMTDDNETIIGKTNPVTVTIHPIPSEENEIIPPADADKIIKGLEEIVQEATKALEQLYDYTNISNKPQINGVTLSGNKSSDNLHLQGKLTAGTNITIDENNEISASRVTIVSGIVNANGTITFTDSDGNTFTTSGSSVIGADGFSPVATVTQTASGATVSITDSTGTTTANITNGQDGNDYILTAQDKSNIADIVLSELPTTQGVLYGNQSN